MNMYRINRVCLDLLLLLILSVSSISAQVVTAPSGYPVIDLSALSPLGAVLSSAEASARRTQMNQQTPSNTAFLGVGESVSGHNGTWNAKMSIKFQVMRANHTVGTTDWANAYNQCKNYNGEGGTAGQWRLPTQRELQMIWILHPQLIGNGSFTAFDAYYYWGSTEQAARNVWAMTFIYARMNNFGKTNEFSVRCIRDLP